MVKRICLRGGLFSAESEKWRWGECTTQDGVWIRTMIGSVDQCGSKVHKWQFHYHHRVKVNMLDWRRKTAVMGSLGVKVKICISGFVSALKPVALPWGCCCMALSSSLYSRKRRPNGSVYHTGYHAHRRLLMKTSASQNEMSISK